MYFLDFVYCINLDEDFAQVLIKSTIGYLWFIMFIFYQNNLNLLKIPLLILALFITLDAFDTIAGNMIMPGASRMQADGYDSEASAIMMQSMHIGGYPLLYSLAFLVFPTTLWIRKEKKIRILLVPIIILFFVTIVYGSYFISLALSLFMFITSFFHIKNIKKFTIYALFFSALFIGVKDYALDGIIFIGQKTETPILVLHAEQLKDDSSDTETKTGGRMELYMGALKNFGNSPLYGELLGDRKIYFSEHSEWLEYLEKYGLFAIVYILFIVNVFKTSYRSLMSAEMKNYFKIYIALVVFFLLVNPMRNEQPLTFCLYFAVPLLFKIIESKEYNKI